MVFLFTLVDKGILTVDYDTRVTQNGMNLDF